MHRQTDRYTDERKDKQPKNLIPPAPNGDGCINSAVFRNKNKQK